MVVHTSHPFTRIFYVFFHFRFGKQRQLFPQPVFGYLISVTSLLWDEDPGRGIYRTFPGFSLRVDLVWIRVDYNFILATCNVLLDSDTRYNTFYTTLKCVDCNSPINHKNYNFLACDWFKNVLFSTNSLAKLLSDSLLLDSLLLDSLLSDSLISQSHSKMYFKSTNHIQSCNYVCVRARCCFCAFALDPRDVYSSFVSILMRIFPFFITSLFFFFSEIVIFMIN